ncbi:hypothetical protein G6F24_017656 [Rhizopus arrhizus]|nr:hypothetical protein G6F24_017656 [Rhizopus arrhizus]
MDAGAQAAGRPRRWPGVRHDVPCGRMGTRGQPRRQPAAARQYQGALLRAGNGGGVAEGRPAGHPALRRLRRSDTRAYRLRVEPG